MWNLAAVLFFSSKGMVVVAEVVEISRKLRQVARKAAFLEMWAEKVAQIALLRQVWRGRF
jgi:hypothetical protein